MSPEREQLHSALLQCMEGGPDTFPDLALRLFAYQFAHNAPYRAYCEALATTPASVTSWTQIPPVPAEVFKSGLHLATFPPEQTIRTFLTSGTSGETRGSHHFRDLSLYEASIRHGWRHANLPPLDHAYFAAPPPAHSPHSSLAHMFEVLCPDDNPTRWLASAPQTIDPTPLTKHTDPLLLFGTTLSLLHLCDTTAPLPLPPGSHLFQTGGFKGVTTAHDPATATARISKHFHLDDQHLIHEYGMTELSSQCYAIGSNSPFRCPPWLRVQIIDPATNQPLPPGDTGYLVLYDLANLDSVLAIRTRDFAVAVDHATFHLLGRDPAALPRGCSRASDAYFQASS